MHISLRTESAYMSVNTTVYCMSTTLRHYYVREVSEVSLSAAHSDSCLEVISMYPHLGELLNADPDTDGV
jgi:hypothetical protein